MNGSPTVDETSTIASAKIGNASDHVIDSAAQESASESVETIDISMVETAASGKKPSNVINEPENIAELVLEGSCPFDRLPPLGRKIVRIFISSTFSG
jgi:hypothetical protein